MAAVFERRLFSLAFRLLYCVLLPCLRAYQDHFVLTVGTAFEEDGVTTALAVAPCGTGKFAAADLSLSKPCSCLMCPGFQR